MLKLDPMPSYAWQMVFSLTYLFPTFIIIQYNVENLKIVYVNISNRIWKLYLSPIILAKNRQERNLPCKNLALW